MAGARNPMSSSSIVSSLTQSLARTGAGLSLPWSRQLKLTIGTFITPALRLVRPLGDAGASNVWVADHLGLQSQVAVKFGLGASVPSVAGFAQSGGVPADAGLTQAAPQGVQTVTQSPDRFLRQARVAAKLGDPHLVQVFEHGMARGVPFIVTELLEGKSLRRRLLHGGALSLVEARAVASQIAETLAKGHPLHLLHGSLCPDHLLLIETGGRCFVKLLNFGDPGVVPGMASLELGYQSPEQLLQATGNSAAADLWALAVTMYELLTTILPFEAPTAAGVTVAICNGQFSPPTRYRADLPLSVDGWFARALAREPLDRFRDASEFAQSFLRATANPAPAIIQRDATDMNAELEDDDEDEELTRRFELPADFVASTRVSALPGALAAIDASSPTYAASATGYARPRYPESALLEPALFDPGLMEAGLLDRRSLDPGRSSAGFALSVRNLRAQGASITHATPRARGLLVGALVGAAGALLVWGFQSLSSESDGSTLGVQEEPSSQALTPTSANPGGEDLPAIIQSDELPPAPEGDEEEDAQELAVTPPASVSSRVPSAVSAAVASGVARALNVNTSAKSPAPLPAQREAAQRPIAQPAPAAPAPSTVAPAAAASKTSRCNPPYYFDRNNIRRIKLECL
jgi:serine/threonine protein kinase